MSKTMSVLPRGLLKNTLVGAGVALLCYVLLQFPGALLIHGEILGEGMMYPLICVAAGASSFVGCAYSVRKAGVGSALSASAVVAVFLVLTLAAGCVIGWSDGTGDGFAGIGGAMAAGGLAAALLPFGGGKRNAHKSGTGRRRKVRRQGEVSAK